MKQPVRSSFNSPSQEKEDQRFIKQVENDATRIWQVSLYDMA